MPIDSVGPLLRSQLLDHTVDKMLRGGASLEEIIWQLVQEKQGYLEIAAEAVSKTRTVYLVPKDSLPEGLLPEGLLPGN